MPLMPFLSLICHPQLTCRCSYTLNKSASFQTIIRSRSSRCLRPCRPIVCCLGAAERHKQTPLLDAVAAVGSHVDQVPLHVPGHKRGSGVIPHFKDVVGMNALQHDLTELAGLDYLSSPTGAILQAQQLAAEAFGADQTWFLVNGTTVGIHAAVMAVCAPGDTLVAARNCHLSAVSAMVLSGCRPEWVQPRIVSGWDIAQYVTAADLDAAFCAAADESWPARAALIVSPTYFGTASDIPGLAAVCHKHGALLIVDEAHGAHCRFDDRFPQAALGEAGDHREHADIVIQSTHKMLGSLTQSAMLHCRGDRAQHLNGRISRALQTLQSSSPSYLLLASLDAARAAAAAPGAFDEALSAADVARQGVAALNRLRLPSNDDCLHGVDPLKLTVAVDGLGMTGFQAADWLLSHHGIATELATSTVVLAAFGIGSTERHAQRFVEAMQALCEVQSGAGVPTQPAAVAAKQIVRLPWPLARMTPREAHFAASERVLYNDAVGRISCELLCPYPPGIPAIVPGEVFTKEILEQLRLVLVAGGVVTGAGDAELNSFEVVYRDPAV